MLNDDTIVAGRGVDVQLLLDLVRDVAPHQSWGSVVARVHADAVMVKRRIDTALDVPFMRLDDAGGAVSYTLVQPLGWMDVYGLLILLHRPSVLPAQRQEFIANVVTKLSSLNARSILAVIPGADQDTIGDLIAADFEKRTQLHEIYGEAADGDLYEWHHQ